MIHIFKTGTEDESVTTLLTNALEKTGYDVLGVEQEFCFNIELEAGHTLTDEDEKRLLWLLAETFEPEKTSRTSFLVSSDAKFEYIVETGPRLTFCTAWSSNAVSICSACGLSMINRMERSRRYAIKTTGAVSPAHLRAAADAIHDRMTECVYPEPLSR